MKRPDTCQSRPCAICHDHAHDQGAFCPSEDRCPVKAIHLGVACRRCYDKMHAQLTEIPELYALALGELGVGAGGSGGRSTETSLGVRVAALDLRAGGDVLEQLGTWERDWREHFNLDPVTAGNGRQQALDRYSRGAVVDSTGTSLVGVCGFLAKELHRACEAHYAIDEFARDLTRLHAEARSAARTTGRSHTEVECPADHADSGICGARIRITGLELHDVTYCRRCNTRWEIKRLLLVTEADSEASVWLAAEDVTLLLGIPRRTLFRWAKDGKVQRKSGLFDVSSVRSAIQQGGRSASA